MKKMILAAAVSSTILMSQAFAQNNPGNNRNNQGGGHHHGAGGHHHGAPAPIDRSPARGPGGILGQRRWSSLTRRERQIILTLMAEGLSNKDVGRRLNLSEGTVKVHLHNIYQKLQVNKRTALVAIAHAHREELQQHIASYWRADELNQAGEWGAPSYQNPA
jgi:DNA-binding NarL/FixJ family response regulator